jgi:hypothetical protein
MVIVTKFDIGDTVRIGPHEGRVMSLRYADHAVYEVGFWVDGAPASYDAYDWELELIAKAPQAD